MSDTDDNPLPVVMIAGAGLGGLLLAVIFERNGIPYQIFERATKLKPLGMIHQIHHTPHSATPPPENFWTRTQRHELNVGLAFDTHILTLLLSTSMFAGSTFGFGCNILPAFEQLGLLEDLLRVSYPTYSIDMYDTHLKPIGGFSFKRYKKMYGPMGERERIKSRLAGEQFQGRDGISLC